MNSRRGLTVATTSLPALRISGQPARAHTQGLEIKSGNYYVTARRDDVLPKRALLLRTDPHGTDWDVWALLVLQNLDSSGGQSPCQNRTETSWPEKRWRFRKDWFISFQTTWARPIASFGCRSQTS